MQELHLSLFVVIDCYCCFTRSSLGSLCVRVLSRSGRAVSRVSGGGLRRDQSEVAPVCPISSSYFIATGILPLHM